MCVCVCVCVRACARVCQSQGPTWFDTVKNICPDGVYRGPGAGPELNRRDRTMRVREVRGHALPSASLGLPHEPNGSAERRVLHRNMTAGFMGVYMVVMVLEAAYL